MAVALLAGIWTGVRAEDLPPPALQWSKSVVSPSGAASAGEWITFRIRVANNNVQTANNITIWDELPSGLSLDPGSISTGNYTVSYNQPQHRLEIQIAALPGGQMREVLFSTKSVQTFPACVASGNLTNQVRIVSVAAPFLPTPPVLVQVPVRNTIASTPVQNTNPIYFSEAIACGILPAGGISGPGITNLNLDANWVVDVPYNFTNVLFNMRPGAALTVAGGTQLSMTNCTVRAGNCGRLWHRILVQAGGTLRLEGCLLRDAQYAVEAENKAELSVRNTEFLNNFIGIYARPSAQPKDVNFNGGNFMGNRFRSTAAGTLPAFNGAQPRPLPAQTGQPGLAGIWVEDVLALDLRLNQPNPSSNRFNDLVGGITAFRTHVLLNTCNFTNIRRNDVYATAGITQLRPNGVGIYLGGDVKHRLEIFGDRNLANFNICYKDIETSGVNLVANSLVSRDNLLRSIGFLFAYNCKIEIENNLIQRPWGVGVYGGFNDPAGSISIKNNTVLYQQSPIYNPNPPEYVAGIVLSENGNNHSPTIKNNTIRLRDDYAIGIHIQSVSGANVVQNSVTYAPSSNSVYQRGILLEAAKRVRCTCNSVTGAWGFLSHAFLSSASDGRLSCNTSDRTALGFAFKGANSLDFRGNTMLLHGNSLSIANSSFIGAQPYRGNTFPLNPVSAPIPFNEAENQNGANPLLIAASRFTVNNSYGGGAFYPNPVFPQGNTINDWFYEENTFLNFDCSQDPSYCDPIPQQLQQQGLELDYKDSLLASGSFPSGGNVVLEHTGKRQLYRKLLDASFPVVCPLFAGFCQGQQGQCLGGLELVERKCNVALAADTAHTTQWTPVEARLRLRLDSLLVAENALHQNPNPTLSAQRQQLADALAGDLQDMEALLQTYRDDLNGELDQSAQINTGLLPGTVPETWEREVNAVYLQTAALGNVDFDAAQHTLLRSIAERCPLEEGTAVWRARGLLFAAGEWPWLDDRSCEPLPASSARLANLQEQTDEQIRYKAELYPNPTRALSQIDFDRVLSGSLECFDLNGSLLFRQSFPAVSVWQFSVADLEPGLYFCRILTPEGSRTLRLTVLRP